MFLSKLVLRRALNPGLGSCRRMRAMSTRPPTAASTEAGSNAGSCTILLTSSSNRSINGCLLIASTYSSTQSFYRSKLKLFDCTFGPAELFRNISDAFLFNETLNHDAALVFRKTVNELKHARPPLDLFPIGLFK